MTIATNSNDVSTAALNAINKIADARFQQLQSIQTQFLWSTIYIYGTELMKPTTSAAFVNDPRNIYYTDKTNTSYLVFAEKYKVIQQYVYIDKALGKPINSNFIKTADEMVQKCDFANILIKDDSEKLASCVGALMYFGKWETFKKLMGEIYNIPSQSIISTFNKYKELIEEQQQKLGRLFKISSDDIKKINGYVSCVNASFCSSELKQEYLQTKEEYEQMIKELYNIVQGVPSLSVCYNNNSMGNVLADNDGIAYVNVKQVINCAGEQIAEESTKGEADTMTTILKNISELKASNTTKTEIIDKINKRIDTESDKIEKLYNKNIIIIIVLLVIFIMCIISLALSVKNKNIKQNGGYIDLLNYDDHNNDDYEL